MFDPPVVGQPGGAGVPPSLLLNLKVVGSNPGGALAVIERSLSVTITELSKARCVVPCLWDIAQKRALAILRKE